jgi:hypothetical protein
MSCKQGKLWDLVYDAGHEISVFVANHGMIGLQLTVEYRAPNWELRSVDGVAPPRQWPERVLCAAIQLEDGKPVGPVGGHRHHDIINTVIPKLDRERWAKARLSGSYTQGFLTTKGRFLTREDARCLALGAGQIEHPLVPTHKPDELFSEDLY